MRNAELGFAFDNADLGIRNAELGFAIDNADLGMRNAELGIRKRSSPLGNAELDSKLSLDVPKSLQSLKVPSAKQSF